MPNTATYKDWLFVTVPEDGHSFQLHLKYNHVVFYEGTSSFKAMRDFELPPGSWQIIGKGDAIDWKGIVDVDEQFRERIMYKMYGVVYDEPEHARIFATTDIKKAAASLLRSLGMEPETTLILKKQ